MASIASSPRSAAASRTAAASVGVQREGLLDEHVLAGLERQQGVGGVHRMGRGDVDDVDVGIGDEVLVRAVGAGDVEVGGERLGGLAAARSHGGDVEPRGAEVGGERPCDAPGTEDAPARGGRAGRLPAR